MDDRSFTLCRSKCWAWGLAAATLTLLTVAAVVGSADLRGFGLACSAAAAVAWIRRYFIRCVEQMSDTLTHQGELLERAFAFGMEAGRNVPRDPAQHNGHRFTPVR